MLKFDVKTNEWWADGEMFPAGENEVESPSPDLVRLAAHAHSDGAIEVTEGLDESHIQTQEQGEAALAEAMGTADPITGAWDGPWAEGNRLAFEARAAAVAEEAAASIDTEWQEGGEAA